MAQGCISFKAARAFKRLLTALPSKRSCSFNPYSNERPGHLSWIIVFDGEVINYTRKSRSFNILNVPENEMECVKLTLKDTNLWWEMCRSNAVQLRAAPEQQTRSRMWSLTHRDEHFYVQDITSRTHVQYARTHTHTCSMLLSDIPHLFSHHHQLSNSLKSYLTYVK